MSHLCVAFERAARMEFLNYAFHWSIRHTYGPNISLTSHFHWSCHLKDIRNLVRELMPFKRLITLSGLEQNGVLINYKPSTWPIKCHREHASPQSINFFRKVCILLWLENPLKIMCIPVFNVRVEPRELKVWFIWDSIISFLIMLAIL